MSNPIKTKFATEMPGSLFTKFEENRPCLSQETVHERPKFHFNACWLFFFISHTCKFGHKMQIHTQIKLKIGTHKGLINAYLCILVGSWWRFIELWLIFRIKKVKGLTHQHGKLLEGIGWNLWNWLKLKRDSMPSHTYKC